MAIKYICDICGKEVEYKDYRVLVLKKDNTDNTVFPDRTIISGHSNCIKQVENATKATIEHCRYTG